MRQLVLRLLPLILIAVLSAGFVWVFRDANLRNRLNDTAFEAVSLRTYQTVDDYFSPLIETASSAQLWGRIGEISSIGHPENYIDFLDSSLRTINSVSSVSISGSDNNELVLYIPENEDSEWNITEKGSELSLSTMRLQKNIEYKQDESESGNGFSISKPYFLPPADNPGITIRIKTETSANKESLTLCLDLPFSELTKKLRKADAAEATVIVVLLPSGEDAIFLPVDKLLKLENGTVSETALDLSTSLEEEVDSIIALFPTAEKVNGDIHFKFSHDEQLWMTEFKELAIGSENIYIGTMIPEDILWTNQVSEPLQIFLLALLAATVFLLFRLIHDYSSVSKSPARVEEILRDEIAEGESDSLEFKSSLRWDYREDKVNKDLEEIIVKSVAAFSNSNGGSLLIGVADDGAILGIEKDYETLRQQGRDYFEIHLRNLLSSRYGVGFISKNIAVDFPWLSGHEICRIKMRRGRQPLFTTVKSKGGAQKEKFFVRSGNTSQVLETPSEITAYVYSRFSSWRLSKILTEQQ